MDKSGLEKIFVDNGFDSFRWINSKDIVISEWVRFKCMFGCSSYGKNASCPPSVPSVSECRDFISNYSDIVVFKTSQRFADPDDRAGWGKEIDLKLLHVEKKVFLAGFHKVFLLFMDVCQMCNACTGSRSKCNNPEKSRPCAESLGIDIFSTVRNCGFPIQVLKDYSEVMNRYSFLLVE